MEQGAPQTKSLSRVWFVLKNATRYLHHCLLICCTLISKTISTFAPTTINSDVEHDLFSSLPDEIVVTCLARISRSYYPKLCLVCKRFRTLIYSNDLRLARYHMDTEENVLYVCLKLPDHRLPSWFTLWIKPDQTLTNNMVENNNSTGNTLLVRVPSSHSPRLPFMFKTRVDSKFYAVRADHSPPTSSPLVSNDGIYATWRKGPSMKVAREHPVAGILDGKIYVMGGCSGDESKNWAEVFDTKTQFWESLPDPGPELRFSLIKRVNVRGGKVYVSSSEKDYFYDPKESSWGVASNTLEIEQKCVIENVWYHCGQKGRLSWYDIKRKEWREVKGLEVLNRNCGNGGVTAIANYSGKLLILWDKSVQPDDERLNKDIWCCVIGLERRNGGDEFWGNVEWSSVVLTVPSSYVFLRCEVRPF